jgi:exodeoxyribonuclease-5
MTDITAKLKNYPITFSQQQVEALTSVNKWYGQSTEEVKKKIFGSAGRRWFMLSGYAGTGKTTVARAAQDLTAGPDDTLFVAPTGKAASVLRRKGCDAMTIHRAIYRTSRDEVTRKLTFTLKERLENARGKDYKLIICDEASMVGTELGRDLMSFGVPILALGDPAQLPPVKGDPVFTADAPDYLLSKIMRQAKDSNILKAARAVRKAKDLEAYNFEDLKVRMYGRPSFRDYLQFVGLEDDAQIICGFNKTRQQANQLIRNHLGFSRTPTFDFKLPKKGEKLICTFNDYDQGICNGEQFVLLSEVEILPEDENLPKKQRIPKGRFECRPSWDLKGQEKLVLTMNLDCFTNQDDQERSRAMSKPGGFDLGYCITCHKSQGSEWERVLAIRELIPGVDPCKWTYTAITRASKHLTLFW